MKNDDYIVPSVNYCDGLGLGRCFRFVCIYAYAAVFLCATVFSVNKDLYYIFRGVAVRGPVVLAHPVYFERVLISVLVGRLVVASVPLMACDRRIDVKEAGVIADRRETP